MIHVSRTQYTPSSRQDSDSTRVTCRGWCRRTKPHQSRFLPVHGGGAP
jgi:hypothetical protein